ncbi:MAG: Ig-like domain-containing protein [Bacteroidota bacterium]|nr:Ig-like domain-containing protein [Bacteroidota bacterium]
MNSTLLFKSLFVFLENKINSCSGRLLNSFLFFASLFLLIIACDPSDDSSNPPVPKNFELINCFADQKSLNKIIFDISNNPEIRLIFSEPLDSSTVRNNIFVFKENRFITDFNFELTQGDSALILNFNSTLAPFTKYFIDIRKSLSSKAKRNLFSDLIKEFITQPDTTDKFIRLDSQSLLDTVQKACFRYFWDFAHPVSGLIRERNSSADIVTTGGSGFGIMCIVVACHRNWINRNEAVDRLLKIIDFIENKAQKYHGVLPHWLHGGIGATIPFSANDNGGDLVETSYFVAGLLTARQYFNSANPNETELRKKINAFYDGVEWDWYRKNSQNVLYWHWSIDKQWIMNFAIKGWNEALLVYVLAAASNTHAIPPEVYHEGWARDGKIKNGNYYFNINLPLGPHSGGPLFFSHYSFLGIDPFGLKDNYADYQIQVTNHTLINYNYCIANPRGYYGYSSSCWGLTSSDVPNGYSVNEPNNDHGVIAPTASLSSFPYTPYESNNALEYFYYKWGDRLWNRFGFVDAFSLQQYWFAQSTLAIDQGPIMIMIENHRSKLIWNQLMSCEEIKRGMKTLGFNSPHF